MLFNQRVLCVDDQPDVCGLVTITLQESEVTPAWDAGGALKLAMADKFGIILLDYYLPDGNGLDLCRKIRAFDATTPILIITATHSISHEEAISAGAQGVMRKDHLAQLLPAAVAQLHELKVTMGSEVGRDSAF